MSKYIPNAFQIPNAVVDEHMATLSGTAFKCYAFIIRKTAGWNKEIDFIPITQFMQATGIKKKDTIGLALAELEELGLIERIESRGKVTGYRLNLFNEKKETNPENGGDPKNSSHPENGGAVTPKMVVTSNPENGGTSKPTTKPTNTKPIISQSNPKNFQAKPKTHLPDDFAVPDDWIDWAKGERPELPTDAIYDLFESFKDHHLSKANKFADWKRAWQTWVRNDKKFHPIKQKANDDDIFRGCVNYG